jgi:lysophospholipase L1-like esterase
MTAGYDGRGARFPLTIVRDSDVALELTVTSGGSPVNLSAATIEGEIYPVGSTTPAVTMTAVVSGAGSNVVTLSLTDVQTLALTSTRYAWTLWVTRGGDKRPWLAGQVNVTDGTTGQSGTSGSYTLTVDGDLSVAVDVAVVGARSAPYGLTLTYAAVGVGGSPAVMPTPPTLSTQGPGGSVSGLTGSVPYNTSLVTLRGCLAVLINQFSTDYYYNGVNGDWTPPPFWVEFDYYGDDFALVFRDRVGTSGAQFWVWVDGVPATAGITASTANSAGSKFYYRVQFTSNAQRRIQIMMRLADFGGLVFGPTDTVSPVSESRPKVAFYGDSWIEGALSVTDDVLWPPLVGQALQAETFLCGQGSTGFIATGGGGSKGAYTSSTRLTDLVAAAPDVIVLQGSTNDDGSSGIQAAAESVIASIVAALPNASIILCGPPITSSTVTANRTANNTAVLAAATASANVIGTISSVDGGWITGTGTSSAPSGSGNGDVFIGSDGAHLTTAGHTFWATRMYSAIYSLLAGS